MGNLSPNACGTVPTKTKHTHMRCASYKVPKKNLQLEVKRVATEIGHIPTRDELVKLGRYSIEYYDKYFVSWGEVTAAARTTGMTETRNGNNGHEKEATQQLQLLERRSR